MRKLGLAKSRALRVYRRLLRPCLMFFLTLFLLRLLLGLQQPQHLLYVWPLVGVQLALLLSNVGRKASEPRLEILAASGAVLVSSLAAGLPVAACLVLALKQILELTLLLWLLKGSVRCFDDLKTRNNVRRFFFAAIVVPFLTSPLMPHLALGSRSALGAWLGIALADSLGIAVFTPAILFLLAGRLWKKDQAFQRFREGSAASALFLLVTIAIFNQNTNPFLFMIFPPLILVVFVLGVRGAIFTSLSATVVGCWATAHGHGPMWLNHSATFEHRILILQIFLWTIVATSFPVGSLLDEQRASAQQALKNQGIYRTLIENSADMIILSSLDGSSRYISPAVEKVTGWTPEEYALSQMNGVHPDDRDLARAIITSLREGKSTHTFRYRAMHKDSSFRWVEAFVHGYRDEEDGPIAGYVATLHDISALKATEETWSAERHALARQNEQLATLAGKDELTGIANRRTFNELLSAEAARQSRSADHTSLLMLDVDFFKKFNDRYGHQAGDVCLQKVARAIDECAARMGDVAARVGGEEFAVLLPFTDQAGAVQVAGSILQAIRDLRLLHEDNSTGFVSVSIGVSTWLPHQDGQSARLLQEADRSLYESKRQGRNRMTVWSPPQEIPEETGADLAAALQT